MNLGEIFENFGLGLGIVITIILLIIVIFSLLNIIPVLFRLLGGFFVIILVLAVIGFVIYFIGKFAKGFIK